MLAKASSILLLYWRIVVSVTVAHALHPAAHRIGLQLQQTALTVSAMPQQSRRQNATEVGSAQLSVVSCTPLLVGERAWHKVQYQHRDQEHRTAYGEARVERR
jgi:hypothetical protein